MQMPESQNGLSRIQRKYLFIGCLIIVLFSFLIGLGIGFAASTSFRSQSSSSAAFQQSPRVDVAWKDAVCSATCKKGWKENPLLLISFDGFRADYLKRNVSHSFNKLIECGSHAPYIYPSFPSKTFPNHYTIATGLYPENHGIVDNYMSDPNIKPETHRIFELGKPSAFNPQWWSGEPIWQTVRKNGKISKSFFWPGSDVNINDMRPNDYRTFSTNVSFIERVEQVLRWLNDDESTRPSLITMYIDEPDATGHATGPQSQKVTDQLLLTDALIDRLMQGLYKSDMIGCLNIIILADHGMQYIAPNNRIIVADYVEQMAGLEVIGGVTGRITIRNSSLTPEELQAKLTCQNRPFRVYTRKSIPTRLHYSRNDRIGDVIIVPEPGYLVQESNQSWSTTNLGNHGFDFRSESMRALFFAYGPAFKKGFTTLPFQNVELYNLMTEVLNLERSAPNDGTSGSLSHLLVNPRPLKVPLPTKTSRCAETSFGKLFCGKNCSAAEKPEEICKETKQETMLSVPRLSISIEDNSAKHQFCMTSLCSMVDSLHSSYYSSNATINTVEIISYKISSTFKPSPSTPPPAAAEDCFYLADRKQCESLVSIQQNLATKSIALRSLLPPEHIKDAALLRFLQYRVPINSRFYEEVWLQLMKRVQIYASEKQEELLVVSGPIYDYNNDGYRDSSDDIEKVYANVGCRRLLTSVRIPSHLFLIVVRCERGFWNQENHCDDGTPEITSFSLPHRKLPEKCQQNISDYLFSYTAKLKDIERQTGFYFFADWNQDVVLRLRVHVNENSWIL